MKLEVLEVRLEEGFISRNFHMEHPVLKELLILRQRTKKNFLLPPNHAYEIQRIWDSCSIIMQNDLIINIQTEIEKDITETEKEQVIKSRIGQSAFKKSLLAIEKKCRLCGVTDERFLVASHIKPWSQSNNQERIDVNNGLLLCPNHDSLFDKVYISFDEEGTILISDSLDELTKVFLNVNDTMYIELMRVSGST